MPRDDVRARRTHPRTVWPWAASLATLSCLATGCPQGNGGQPDPIPGYVLTLRPNVTAGADPFVPGADVSLVIQHDGDLDVMQIGTTNDPSLSMPELPLLQAGDTVGILVEEGGGSPNQWEPELTVGYGQITLEDDLPTDGSSVELDVLVAPFAEVPASGSMGATARFHSGTAMGPDGDVFIFGGVRLGLNNAPVTTSEIHAILDTDEGNTGVDKLNVSMPTTTFGREMTTDGNTYSGPHAVLVDDDDGPLILVTGGRIDWNDPRFNSPSAFLFDPAERDWVRAGGDPLVLDMKTGMSGHRHVKMANGDLVFYGGLFDDAEVRTTVLLYNVGQRRFTEVETGSVTIAVYEPSAASLGPLGAILCGGTDLPGPDDQATGLWPAEDTCLRVAYDGNVTALAPLPEPLTFHGMVELADGRVLVSGGGIGGLPGPAATPQEATDRAWVYDPDADRWTEVGAMNRARAGHALVALPDGGALVIGGVAAATAQDGTTGDAVSCWERFDGTTDTFTDGECNGAGEGLWPRVATAPGEGGFAIAGYGLDNFGGYFVPAGYGLFATGLP